MPLAAVNGIPINPPSAAGARTGVSDLILPVPYYSQDPFRNLCWAACGQMVLGYYHRLVPQICEISSVMLHADCCGNPGSSICDQGVWPWAFYNKCGIQWLQQNRALLPGEIIQEIKARRPVQVYLHWTQGGGTHTILLAGVFTTGEYYILDPHAGVGRGTYNYIVSGYGGHGSWQLSWNNLVPSNAALS